MVLLQECTVYSGGCSSSKDSRTQRDSGACPEQGSLQVGYVGGPEPAECCRGTRLFGFCKI